MEDRNYKLYIHEFPNGKVYIGITQQDVDVRWKNGIGYNGQPPMLNAIKKYGWDNVVHDILAIDLTKEEAEQLEVEWIGYYDSTNRKYGYNVSNGGCSIGKHSDETKKKIGNSNRGKKRTQEQKKALSLAHLNSPKLKGKNNPFYGKQHSNESKKKISEAGKNRDKTTYVHKPVYQIDLDSQNVIREYFSIMDASRETGISDSSIVLCCKGKIGQSGGYKWQYVGEPHEYKPKTGHKKKIVQLDVNGNYIATFDSISYASKVVGVCCSTITRSCSHITKTHKEYIWVYLDEYEGRAV